jgi:hypothetical protein
MLIVKSNRADTKAHDGVFVTRRNDLCVVESEDGKLLIVSPGELTEGIPERITIQSDRPHLEESNGKEVRVIRAIKKGDGGYSRTVPQVVVAPKDGSAELTVQTTELVDSTFEECDAVVHSNRPELKAHKGESVRVLRSVMPGDNEYAYGGHHQYWVRGKDKKEFAVEAGELKMTKAIPKADPAAPHTSWFGGAKKEPQTPA